MLEPSAIHSYEPPAYRNNPPSPSEGPPPSLPFHCAVLEAADSLGGPSPGLLHSLREQGCKLILAQVEDLEDTQFHFCGLDLGQFFRPEAGWLQDGLDWIWYLHECPMLKQYSCCMCSVSILVLPFSAGFGGEDWATQRRGGCARFQSLPTELTAPGLSPNLSEPGVVWRCLWQGLIHYWRGGERHQPAGAFLCRWGVACFASCLLCLHRCGCKGHGGWFNCESRGAGIWEGLKDFDEYSVIDDF